MNTKILIGIVGILFLMIACTPQGPLQGPFVLQDPRANTHELSVGADGQMDFSPDQAEFWLSFTGKAQQAQQAQDQTTQRVNRVIQALKDVGVATDKIETTQYSVNPDYSWNPSTGKQDFQGYVATHSLKISLTDIEKTGELLDLSIKNGADTVQNVQFSLSKTSMKTAQTKILGMAASRAKEKADAIAQGLGLTLGKIRTITESNANYQPYPYAYNNYPMMAEAMVKAPEIPTQKVSLSTHVDIVYEIV